MSHDGSEQMLLDKCAALWPTFKFTHGAAAAVMNGPLRDFSVGDVMAALDVQFDTDPDSRSPSWKAAKARLYGLRRTMQTQARLDGADWIRVWLRGSNYEMRFELIDAKDLGPFDLELWHDVLMRDGEYGHRFGRFDPAAYRGDELAARIDRLDAMRGEAMNRKDDATAWRLGFIADDCERHVERRLAELTELDRRARQLKIVGHRTEQFHSSLSSRIGHEFDRLGVRSETYEAASQWQGDAPWA